MFQLLSEINEGSLEKRHHLEKTVPDASIRQVSMMNRQAGVLGASP
jgi:hypothetical protein